MADSKGMSDVLETTAHSAMLAGSFMGAGAAASKSIGDKAAFNIQADAARTNAELDRAAASDAVTRGQKAVAQSQLKTNQVKGMQIAAMAANGVDLSSDTPLDILTTTDLVGATDANIIAANAAKEAWGYRVRAGSEDANAALLDSRAGMENPWRAAATSLLTSGGAVASKWYGTRRYIGGD